MLEIGDARKQTSSHARLTSAGFWEFLLPLQNFYLQQVLFSGNLLIFSFSRGSLLSEFK